MNKNNKIIYTVLSSITLITLLVLSILPVSALEKIPINTCSGNGDLFLYEGSPFQNPDTSFETDFDELLIFTRGGYVTQLKVGATSEGANILSNSDFDAGVDPWDFFSDASGAFTTESGAAKVSISSPGINVQLYQYDLELEPNTAYKLTFDAKSNTGHDLKTYVHKHGAPYTNYGLNGQVFDVNSDWQTFTVNFTTSGFGSTVNDARLRFWLAPYDATGDIYYIDNVKLVPLTGSSTPELVASENTPFSVKIYRSETNPGDVINVDATVNGNRGARGIQAYLAQDSYDPIFDPNNLDILYDDEDVNTVYLLPGSYQYLFFDKYTQDQPGQDTDNRIVNVTITGPSGQILQRTHLQPSPFGTQGVVLDDFDVIEEGYYDIAVYTEDSIYWSMLECDANEIPEFGTIAVMIAMIAGIGVLVFFRQHE